MLAQDDRTLGLRPKGGRPEGYRPKLVALLRGWQEEANEALAGYDGLLGGGLARVTACAEEKKEKKEKKRKK